MEGGRVGAAFRNNNRREQSVRRHKGEVVLKLSRRALLCSAAVAGALGCGGAAFAQGAGSIQLDEVVITAERREESLQRSALAVSVASGEDIERAGVTRAEDLSRLAPALTLNSGGAITTQLFMRGVGNYNGNAYFEQAISFNYDGVHISRAGGVNGLFYDLQRVEILKGPQGTLYGRNATGGAVNVLPNRPTFEFEGGVGADIGSYDLMKFDGFVNLPLMSDRAALRLAFQTVRRDGYFDDGLGDDESDAVRAMLRLEPTESLSINIGADYAKLGGRGAGATLFTTREAQFDGLHTPQVIAVYRSFNFPEVGRSPISGESWTEFVDNEWGGIHATIDWRTPIGRLTLIPAYRHGEQDYFFTNIGFNGRVRETDKSHSLEARLGSNADQRLRYVLGAYWFQEDISADQYYNQVINATRQIFELDTETWALFGQATFDVTDSLRLVGGLRYTEEEKTQSGTTYTVIQAPGIFRGMTVPIRTPGSGSWDNTSGKVGVEWDVAEASLIYANVATGFKAGGFYNATPPNAFDPETLTAYTIGSKNRFFENRLQLNIEAFYWEYKDQQVSYLGQRADGQVLALQENVGKSTIQGVEVEAQFLMAKNTLITGSVQYNDAVYDDFVYNLVNFNGPAAARSRTGCPITGPTNGILYRVDCSGFQVPQAPKWNISAGIEQTFPLSTGARIVADIRTNYRSERYLSFDFLPNIAEGDTTRTDASVTYFSPEDRWSVSAYVRNIEDDAVKMNAFQHPFLPIAAGVLEAPRTYGVRLRANF